MGERVVRRVLKWAGAGVAGLLVLAVLAGLLLPALVSLERYRSLLAGRIGKALGREVSLGALSVSLWRGLGAEATGVRVAQAPGFGEAPLLTAETLRLHVQLLPLLRGQVKVSSLTLERPRLLLLRGADGRWGVGDLLRGGSPPPPARPAPEAPRVSRGPAAAAVLLSEVNVRDGEVRVGQAGRPGAAALGLTGFQLRLRQGGLAEPLEVQARGLLAGPDGGSLESTGRIQLADPEAPALELLVKLTGAPASLWRGLLPGRAAAALSGTLSGAVQLTGPLPRLGFDGRLDLSGLGLSIGKRFEKSRGEQAALVFRGRREGPGLSVSAWRLEMKGEAVEGSLRLPDLARPHASFAAAAPRLDLDKILARPKGAHARLLPAAATAWAAAPSAAEPAEAASPSVDGTLRIGELAHAGLVWKGMEADLHYQDGVLKIPRLAARLLTGGVRGRGEVDLRPRLPRVSLAWELENLPTEPLGRALDLGSWRLESRLTLSGRISFVGLGQRELLGSAVGQGRLRLAEGRLTDYPPLDRLAEVIAPVLARQGVRTRLHEFSEVRGDYTVEGGILRSQNLTVVKPEGTVTLRGALGLLDHSLDAEAVARLGRSTVEAKLAGTTDRPIVVPRLDKLQRKLDAEIDKLLPEEQGRGLKDLFRRFFGR